MSTGIFLVLSVCIASSKNKCIERMNTVAVGCPVLFYSLKPSQVIPLSLSGSINQGG